MKKSAKPSANKKIANEKAPSSQKIENNDLSLWRDPFVHILIILATGFLVYFTTTTYPFLFDDLTYLVDNPTIRDFSFFTDTNRVLPLGINPDVKNNFILRPVAYFSFALNYALHGLDVRGYHLANLIIHIGNGLLVYLLLSLLLRAPALTGDLGESDSPAKKLYFLPLFCALIFVSHPVQTQAVTYIIQRFVPLVTLFYLGSLVLYLYSRLNATASARIACYLFSFISAILAMETKENAFTLPVVVTLLEFVFFDGRIGKRIAGLIPFLLTLVIIPVKIMGLSSLATPDDSDAIVDSINLVNFAGVSPLDYLMTQFGVIITYIRLMIMPIGQNLDYDYQLQQRFFSLPVLLPLCLLLIIMGTGIYLLYRSRDNRLPERSLYKITAFGIFWFFIALSVESSIIPLEDLIFEHRVYLPSIGLIMSIIAGVASVYSHRTGKPLFASKMAINTLCIVIFCLAATSMARNTVWKNKVTFWSDVAEKSPLKFRSHNNLGMALGDEGNTEAAINEFRIAIRLKPSEAIPRINLGKALLVQKRYEEATRELLAAAQLNPKNPIPHVVLGDVYEAKGDLSNARRSYLTAVKISSANPAAHLRLGDLSSKENNIQAAIKEYEAAMQLYPDENIRKKVDELKLKSSNSTRQ